MAAWEIFDIVWAWLLGRTRGARALILFLSGLLITLAVALLVD